DSSPCTSSLHTRLNSTLHHKLSTPTISTPTISTPTISTLHSQHTSTMTSPHSSLSNLCQLICSHVSNCVSQGSCTDSKLASLQCRVEGKKCDDAFIKSASLVEAEEHVTKQCEDESACLNDLYKLL
ncbi:hypothetical protein ADUPG1_005234, partial [Aduncisulcus paluster]